MLGRRSLSVARPDRGEYNAGGCPKVRAPYFYPTMGHELARDSTAEDDREKKFPQGKVIGFWLP